MLLVACCLLPIAAHLSWRGWYSCKYWCWFTYMIAVFTVLMALVMAVIGCVSMVML